MTPTTTQQRSRLRLYLTVVGIVGLVPCAVHLTEDSEPLSSRVLAGLGLVLLAAYLLSAVFFRWAAARGMLVPVTGSALAWSLLVVANMMRSPSRPMLIPILLFVVVPALSALWSARDIAREGSSTG